MPFKIYFEKQRSLQKIRPRAHHEDGHCLSYLVEGGDEGIHMRGCTLPCFSRPVVFVPKKSKEETRNDVTRKLEFVAVSLSGLHSEREESLAGKSNRIEEERSVTSVSVEKGHVLNQQQQNPPTRLAPASSSLHTWTHTRFAHDSTEEENHVEINFKNQKCY
ncbi:unnamed protein product [Orchesella dallaii]|uniref:Uncharacterized protein n=1 Tax=Orchesella dallaii TaxID=48710 RepID=A0ABP1R410_9HEXA